jgi:mannose-6-phosphate isomerase
MSLRPFRLLPSFREKIWGATALEPWFRNPTVKIGEVWFSADDNLAEDGRTLGALVRDDGPALLGRGQDADGFPILVKFLFTTDRLSLQVHPNDEQARAAGGGPGKTEMWYILRAEPASTLALGFKEPIARERLFESAIGGEIEGLVRWVPVRAGDTFFTPAGVVHAIGTGIALVEIQQNSDITYRLYDYGRPRELHLEKGVPIADLGPCPGPSITVDAGAGRRVLARCEHFAAESIEWTSPTAYEPDASRMDILVFLEGSGSLDGRPFGPGEVWVVPASAAPFPIGIDAPVRLLRTYVPPRGA